MVQPPDSDEVRAFQRCAVDVVTALLEEVVSLDDREVIPIRYWSRDAIDSLGGGLK
jgi:hypothetical protein